MKNIHTKSLAYLALGVFVSQWFWGIANIQGQSTTYVANADTTEVISDEADISFNSAGEDPSHIISDEANLVTQEVASPVVEKTYPTVSAESLEIAKGISDRELLRMFVENKSDFIGRSSGSHDYDSFMSSWKQLSRGYSAKTPNEALYYKQVFIENYLHLK